MIITFILVLLVLHSQIFPTVILSLKLSHFLYLSSVNFQVILFFSSVMSLLSSTLSHTGPNSTLFILLVIFNCPIATVMFCCVTSFMHIGPLMSQVIHKLVSRLLTIFFHPIPLYHLSLMKSFLTFISTFHFLILKCPIHYSKLLYVVHIHTFVFSTAHKVDNINCLYVYSQLSNSSQSFDLLIPSIICPLKLIKTLSKLYHHYNYFISTSIANNLC